MAVVTGHTCRGSGFAGSRPIEQRKAECPACQRQAAYKQPDDLTAQPDAREKRLAEIRYRERQPWGCTVSAHAKDIPWLLEELRASEARAAKAEATVRDAPHAEACPGNYLLKQDLLPDHCNCWKKGLDK